MTTWKPDYNKTPRRIVCAAAQHHNGAVIISVRHFDAIMHNTVKERKCSHPDENWKDSTQGFVDQFGQFLTRTEAWIVAVQSGQIYRLVGNQTKESLNKTDVELYSENLY